MDEYIIRIIEEDVDGCGSSSEVYVQLKEKPSSFFPDQFKEAIQEAMTQAEEWDTESLVEDALDILKRHGICSGEVVSQPFFTTITF